MLAITSGSSHRLIKESSHCYCHWWTVMTDIRLIGFICWSSSWNFEQRVKKNIYFIDLLCTQTSLVLWMYQRHTHTYTHIHIFIHITSFARGSYHHVWKMFGSNPWKVFYVLLWFFLCSNHFITDLEITGYTARSPILQSFTLTVINFKAETFSLKFTPPLSLWRHAYFIQM